VTSRLSTQHPPCHGRQARDPSIGGSSLTLTGLCDFRPFFPQTTLTDFQAVAVPLFSFPRRVSVNFEPLPACFSRTRIPFPVLETYESFLFILGTPPLFSARRGLLSDFPPLPAQFRILPISLFPIFLLYTSLNSPFTQILYVLRPVLLVPELPVLPFSPLSTHSLSVFNNMFNPANRPFHFARLSPLPL